MARKRGGARGSERTQDAQGSGAATDSSRPRVAPTWEGEWGSRHPDVQAGRTCNSPGHAWQAGLLSEPHRLCLESPRDTWGCSPHPSTSICVPHQESCSKEWSGGAVSCWGGGPGGGGSSWGPDTQHLSSGCRPRKGQLQGDKRGQEASLLVSAAPAQGKNNQACFV